MIFSDFHRDNTAIETKMGVKKESVGLDYCRLSPPLRTMGALPLPEGERDYEESIIL